jgi:fermentation-respiration switch protein FrsA (DUF1100 family)
MMADTGSQRRAMPLRIIAVLLAAIVAALGIAGNALYDRAIRRRSKDLLLDLNPALEAAMQRDTAWADAQPFEEMTLRADDGLRLRGYYLPAPAPTTKAVILAHGYSGRAHDMATFARFYYERFGFNGLMPDARGHGASEGDYIGFGWPERKDYLRWIATLVARLGPEAQIALHGVSMGAGTVMMTSGEDLPPQVKCVIEDCGYTSAKDELGYQLRRLYRLPPFPFLGAASIVCRVRAGYFFGQASALRQVAKTRVPIFFIHGADDAFVPTAMVYPLHDACPTAKELLIVPGAAHGLAHATDPAGYERAVAAFLRRSIAGMPGDDSASGA